MIEIELVKKNNIIKTQKAREKGNETSAIGYEVENKIIDELGKEVIKAQEVIKYKHPGNGRILRRF